MRAMARSSCLIGLISIVAIGALAQTTTSNTPTVSASNRVAALQSRIRNHVEDSRFSQAQWGVMVASLDSGKTLFEHNAGKLMVPASNAKLFTAAMALDRLGADCRIVTSVLGSAKPGTNGVVSGDLAIYGRGDPSFSARFNGGDHGKALQSLVNAIAAAGIKRIEGDLVADSSYFRSPVYGDGWLWDDLMWAYGAPVSALSLEDNSTGVLVKPGKQAGEPCQVITRTNCFVIQNETVTLPEKAASTLELRRLPGESQLRLTGGLATGGGNYSDVLSVPHPDSWFISELERALAQRGIVVTGKTRTLGGRESTSSLIEITRVQSPPIQSIVKETMKVSQNLYAQLLFLQTGARVSTDKKQAAEHAAQAEMRKFLHDVGIKPGSVYLKEGSGLSSGCLVCPSAVVTLLTAMTHHKCAAAFVDSLPVAGVDGTLADRFKGTPAEKRVWAKTGTKEFVSAISGYAVTVNNERLVFSIILNGYKDPSGNHSAREETDALVKMLVE